MKKLRSFLILVFSFLLLLQPLWAESVDIYYGPNGGFSPENYLRTLEFSDGSNRRATLANALLQRLYRLEEGSTVKIAMYSMSDYKTLDAMIDVCKDKQIAFKLLLDGAASWSSSSRDRILKRLQQARKQAWVENKPFDFQLAITTSEAMRRNSREAVLDDGKIIWGTMHEKFGIFYNPGNPVPMHSFCGSSNISVTSDKIYAENRVFFDDQPAVARQFQEEFARLWNEYSVVILGPGTPEKYIEVDAVPGYAKIVFNAEPVDEQELTRIDNELLNLVRRVKPDGSLHLAMFSFTRLELAEAILRSAERNPEAGFYLLFDHAQLDDDDPDQGKLAPWFEKKAAEMGLKNIQVRYRFRRNAYGFSRNDNKPVLISYLSLFLHHKVLIVNNEEMALGSYNWSNSAEFLNFENIMLFNGNYTDHQKVVDSFLAEFEALWTAEMPTATVEKPRKGEPQTVTLHEGRKLHRKILKILEKEANHKVLATMDREAFKTFAEIVSETKLSKSKVKSALKTLRQNGLVVKWSKKGLEGYSQAD
jgi:phosphatidylserine/phosphatidylglycerophosphate/cardiolipin synthase-like enzyme